MRPPVRRGALGRARGGGLAGLGIAGREVEARRARAAVELAAGRPEQAAEQALAAMRVAAAAGLPLEAARTQTLAGSALAAAGDRAGALDRLGAAERALTTLGAARMADEAARELRRLGRRVPRGGRRGAAGLSDRELELALLVADGHTNRQIAARLYLSEKTVERHLSNVFRKLGVTSRAAVAGRVGAERLGA